MKRFAFIYNPEAGGGKSEAKRERLQQKLDEYQNTALFQSKVIGDISAFIEQRFQDFDVFVACGGDGTIREIASKLMHTDKQMGIIPMGTGNDLCKTLNIPTEISEALSLVLNGESHKIDVGLCNDFIFLNTLGFGFDGLTNRYANARKHLHPFLCYAISALKAIKNHEAFEVTFGTAGNKLTRKVIMISFANGRVEGGSFWIAPDASITDGKLNCISIKPIKKWLIPVWLPFFFIKKPNYIPYVKSEKRNNIILQCSTEVDIHADGEVIDFNTDKFHIHLAEKALNVICRVD